MTASQLVSSGLRRNKGTDPPPAKKLTNTQQIALLREQLRVAKEELSNVSRPLTSLYTHPADTTPQTHLRKNVTHDNQNQLGSSGDTELATDHEDAVTVGVKRRAGESSGRKYVFIFIHLTGRPSLTHSQRLKRSRAIDPFQSSGMVNSRSTGLVDDWRTRLQSPLGSISPQSLPFDPDLEMLPGSPLASTSSTPSQSQVSLSVRFHHLLLSIFINYS
jgi:hypothetical protein